MKETDGVVNDILRASVVVDVDSHAAEGRDFGGELVEASIVLAFALVSLRHFATLKEKTSMTKIGLSAVAVSST